MKNFDALLKRIFRIAQENLTKKGYVNLCTELLTENQAKDCRLLKLWILIGLGRLWADYDPARWQAVRLVAYAKVRSPAFCLLSAVLRDLNHLIDIGPERT